MTKLTTGTPEIKLNGRTQKDIADNLLEMTVDLAVNLPGSFTLLLNDPEFKIVDDARFTIGAGISISISPADGGNPQLIFTGIIASLEPIFDNDMGGILTLRGYDKSILLTQGKRFRTFLNFSDSSMIQKVVQAAGLTAHVGATSAKHAHTFQFDQTDWDFVMSRAYRNGMILLWDTQKEALTVSAPNPSKATGVTLVFGKTLRRFEPRFKGTGLPGKSITRGWNIKQKAPVEGTASSSRQFQITRLTSNPRSLRPIKNFVVDATISSLGEASQIAKMQLEQHKARVLRAEGQCRGNPGLVPGRTVKIERLGAFFSGDYYLTQVRHEWTNAQGYTTNFISSGLEPDTLLGLLHVEDSGFAGRIPGVVTGLVTNIDDPENLGRVKVKYPWMPKSEEGADMESGWMRVASPDAGPGHGFFFFPSVNTEVLVAFEQGDINAPIVTGCLWNGKDTPLLKTADYSSRGKIKKRVVRSGSGHVITLDDTKGEEKITIVDKTTKNKIVIDSKKNALTIMSAGDLIFEAKGNVSIKGRKLAIMMQQDLTMEAQQKASLTAGGTGKIELSPGGTTLKGTKVDINGTTQTNVSGAMTSVKGTAIVNVQGALVKIN